MTPKIAKLDGIFQDNERAITLICTFSLFLFSFLVILDRHFIGDTSPLFWDLPVYAGAVKLYAAGQDPYNASLLHSTGVPEYLLFTSPPQVAWLFQAIARLGLADVFPYMLIAMHLVALAVIPWASERLFFGESVERLALAGAAFLTLYNTGGIGVFGACNNGAVLSALILASSVPGFRHGRWGFFHAAVLLASIFKPFYIFFWIIPVLAHGFSWRQVGVAVLLALATAAAYAIPAWVDPETFSAWFTSLSQQTLGIGDVGVNVFGAVRLLALSKQHMWLPYAAQIVFMLSLVALLLSSRLKGPELWAALIIIAVFLNPRVLTLDTAIASIPLAFLTARLLPEQFSFALRLIVAVFGLAAIMLVLSYKDIVLPASLTFPSITFVILYMTFAKAGFSLSFPLLREAKGQGPVFGG